MPCPLSKLFIAKEQINVSPGDLKIMLMSVSFAAEDSRWLRVVYSGKEEFLSSLSAFHALPAIVSATWLKLSSKSLSALARFILYLSAVDNGQSDAKISM